MKKYFMLILLTMCFGFIGVVNAAESDLSSIAELADSIGGTEQEIIQLGEGTYTYYYKYVKISDSDFNAYVGSKYIIDNSEEDSDSYVTANTELEKYEESFYGLIPVVNSASDLNDWTKTTDNQINITDLSYESGKHNGYVLAVATVKEGDSNIYVTRKILESKSATTLGSITYLDSDKTAFNDSNSSNSENVNVGEDDKTTSNPSTGVEDSAVYLVPIALVLGSGILLRKNFVFD